MSLGFPFYCIKEIQCNLSSPFMVKLLVYDELFFFWSFWGVWMKVAAGNPAAVTKYAQTWPVNCHILRGVRESWRRLRVGFKCPSTESGKPSTSCEIEPWLLNGTRGGPTGPNRYSGLRLTATANCRSAAEDVSRWWRVRLGIWPVLLWYYKRKIRDINSNN